MVSLQWLEVVNTLQHLPEKVVRTIAEPCSHILKCVCLPYLKPILSIDNLNQPQIPVQPSHPLTCLTRQFKTGCLWSKGVTELEYKGLAFKQVAELKIHLHQVKPRKPLVGCKETTKESHGCKSKQTFDCISSALEKLSYSCVH